MLSKFVLYGNCQINPISSIILKSNKFSSYFCFQKGIKPVHTLGEKDKESLQKILEGVDLFIYQKVGTAFGDFFSTDFLKTFLKKSCIRICLPNCYFRGYHPESVYFRVNNKRVGQFCDYHDINVLREWLNNTSPKNIAKMFLDSEYYSSDLIFKNAQESLSELKMREEECDICISDFIEEHWTDSRLFHTINHPSTETLLELVNRILKLIDIPGVKKDEELPNFSSGIRPPIYKSIEKYTKIACDERIKIHGKDYSLSSYLQKLMEQYENVDSHEIQESFDNFKKSSIDTIRRLAQIPSKVLVAPEIREENIIPFAMI